MTPINNVRVCENRTCRGDGEEVNKANIFPGHVGAESFKAPVGMHCLKAGRAPRPGRLAACVQGPLSAAFPAPPLCLPSLDPTYRSSVLGIRSLPQHQGHTNG